MRWTVATSTAPARLRILIAAAVPADVGAIASALGNAGHEVVTAYRAETALARLAEERPDAVLLDPALPDGEGVAIVARVRARTDVPIIVVADLRDEVAVVAALEAGAIDVVGRPIRVGELIARLNAAVRRGLPASGVFEPSLDGLRVDLGRREATVAGHAIPLTPTEFEIFATLMSQPGRIFTRAQLLNAVRGVAFESYERAIDSHIRNLRRKLEPGDYIVTVHGVGYKFEG